MADVRFVSGVPTAGAFGSDSGTPLIVDIASGDVYALLTGDVVTKVGRVSSEADLVIAQQAYGRHVMPSSTDLLDTQAHLAGRMFDRAVQTPAPNVVDGNDLLAKRAFNRPPTPSVVLGDSQAILADRVFGPKRLPAMWS